MYKALLHKGQKIDRVYHFQYLLQQQEITRLKAECVKQESMVRKAKQVYTDYLEQMSVLYKGSLMAFDAGVYEKNLVIASRLQEEWLTCERHLQVLKTRLNQALDGLVVQNRKIEHLGEKIKSLRLLSDAFNQLQ